MSSGWRRVPAAAPDVALQDAVGGHPLVARLLAQRGITEPGPALAFLDPQHYTPSPPAALVGLERAANLLHDAITRGQKILVWGDFDVDGQTSTALLVAALRELTPANRVRYHVPNRFTEGHGIRPDTLERYLRSPHIAPYLHEQGVDIPRFAHFLEQDALSASRLEDALRQKGVDLARLQNLMGVARIYPDVLRAYLRNADFQPDLLLTCDTGISDAAGVGLAKDAGLTVVITDHHDLPAEFAGCALGEEPPVGQRHEEVGRESVRRADAIVNPKFQHLDDPLLTLPGVGVVYKLMQRVYELAGRPGDAVGFLDLVALGIVADVAEQVHDARFLLQLGLERLRHTQRTGLQALMENARIDPQTLTEEDIGFQIGPRMNALGRLEDATVAVDLLTTHDPLRSGELAAKMERLNNQRRLLTSQIAATAFEVVERNPQYLDFNAVVLAHPAWHAGIVGIVVARLVEEFGKPAVLLLNPPGEPARGSARSTPDVDIGASIAACSELLISHGGHPGAAGCTLPAENIDHFRRELSRQIEHHRIESVPIGLGIDAELSLDELTLDFVAQVQRLAPFGNGNPEPVFMTQGLTVAFEQRIGKNGDHRRLTLTDGATRVGMIWFRAGDTMLPEGPVDFAYAVGVNDYGGERTLQLRYIDSRPALHEGAADETGATQPAAAAAVAGDRRQIIDLRAGAVEPGDLPDPDSAFWLAEGPAAEKQLALFDRDFRGYYRMAAADAAPDRPLVLWSAPPSQQVLAWLLQTLRPPTVYLVGQASSQDSLDVLLKFVAGMGKYALQREPLLPLDQLAARLATTEGVIRHALLCLEMGGHFRLVDWEEDDVVRIEAGAGDAVDRVEQQILRAELDEQLNEVRAYRRFFRRADTETLGLLA